MAVQLNGVDRTEIIGEVLYEHEVHMTAIFPETTNIDCILTANATADQWSAWTEIEDTTGSPVSLSSKFASKSGHITAIAVEETNQANTIYMIEVAISASKTIVSRHRLYTDGVNLPIIDIAKVRAAVIPAGETVYYRVMCETAGSKTLNVHFRYFLHL